MSHRVNSEGFRLGVSRFWKSELFSSYISNFTQKFLAVYLLLKKKLNSFFFKIVFFKIIFLRGQKTLVLVNTYKVVKRLTDSSRKKGLGGGKYGKGFKKVKFEGRAWLKNKSPFKKFLLSKRYPTRWVEQQLRGRLRLRKGLFRGNRTRLTVTNLKLERFLVKLLAFPIEIRLKNVFSYKKKNSLVTKKSISILNICQIIYKKVKNFWKLKRFLYLKDAINILSLAFFYQRSELLADYVSDIIRLRRKFLFELKNLQGVLPYFKKHYFLIYGASLKINVLGKIFGQRKRRFRCFSLSEGLKFSTQNTGLNLSYSLAHTWNVLGSFGVKVWIFKSIVKDARRL